MSSSDQSGGDLDSGPQPTAHNVTPGCTLGRRDLMRRSAAAGASIVTAGAASSRTVTAGDGETEAGLLAGPGGYAVRRGLNYMFGSDDDDEHEEYLENEVLRIHGDLYRDAVAHHSSQETAVTWLQDNTDLLEGRAYIEGLREAYRAIQNESATRDEAIQAAADSVDETYSVPQQEFIEEVHLHLRNIGDKVSRLKVAISQNEGDFEPDDLNDHINIAGHRASRNSSRGSIDEFETDASPVSYELVNGEEIEVPSVHIAFTGNRSSMNGPVSAETPGVVGISDFDPTAVDGEMLILEEDDNPEETGLPNWLIFEVNPFDDAEYRNVYDSDFDDVDGDVKAWDMFEDVAQEILSAHSSAKSNVEAMVDEVYESMVDDEISYTDLETFDSLADSAPDDDPHALVNAHLSMIGRSPSTSHSVVEVHDLDADAYDDDDEMDDDRDEDVEAIRDHEVAGTLYLDPAPDDGLEVGQTYTPSQIASSMGDTDPPQVTFSFTAERETDPLDDSDDPETEEVASFVEFENHREFTVHEAETLDEDGNVVEADELEFSDGLQTETPTDYDEVHDRLDEYEEFHQDLLERQYELAEEMADDDDELTIPTPGDMFPDGGGWLGVGIMGLVVLAVIGFVTDLLPGVGE